MMIKSSRSVEQLDRRCLARLELTFCTVMGSTASRASRDSSAGRYLADEVRTQRAVVSGRGALPTRLRPDAVTDAWPRHRPLSL